MFFYEICFQNGFNMRSVGCYFLEKCESAKVCLDWTSPEQRYQIRIYKNGTLYDYVEHDYKRISSSLTYQTLAISTLMNLSVNDYIEVYVYSTGQNGVFYGGSSYNARKSSFSGFKVD